jgi:hypothetical protein
VHLHRAQHEAGAYQHGGNERRVGCLRGRSRRDPARFNVGKAEQDELVNHLRTMRAEIVELESPRPEPRCRPRSHRHRRCELRQPSRPVDQREAGGSKPGMAPSRAAAHRCIRKRPTGQIRAFRLRWPYVAPAHMSHVKLRRYVAHLLPDDTSHHGLNCRIEPHLDQRGACGAAGAPAAGLCAGGARPAQARRASKLPQINRPIHNTQGAGRSHLPRLPLSSSQAPRLGRGPAALNPGAC